MKTHTFMISYSFQSEKGCGNGYEISKFRHAAEALTSSQVEAWIEMLRSRNSYTSIVPIAITPLSDG